MRPSKNDNLAAASAIFKDVLLLNNLNLSEKSIEVSIEGHTTHLLDVIDCVDDLMVQTGVNPFMGRDEELSAFFGTQLYSGFSNDYKDRIMMWCKGVDHAKNTVDYSSSIDRKEKQRVGIEKARSEGKYKGRQQAEATVVKCEAALLDIKKGLTKDLSADKNGIGVATLYRYIKQKDVV